MLYRLQVKSRKCLAAIMSLSDPVVCQWNVWLSKENIPNWDFRRPRAVEKKKDMLCDASHSYLVFLNSYKSYSCLMISLYGILLWITPKYWGYLFLCFPFPCCCLWGNKQSSQKYTLEHLHLWPAFLIIHQKAKERWLYGLMIVAGLKHSNSIWTWTHSNFSTSSSFLNIEDKGWA